MKEYLGKRILFRKIGEGLDFVTEIIVKEISPNGEFVHLSRIGWFKTKNIVVLDVLKDKISYSGIY